MSTEANTEKTIVLDQDGHLANLEDWNEELAQDLADHEGIGALTDRHWEVINYIREEFEKNGDAPSIRKLTKESGVSTKELYQLFPKGPAKKAAKVAGLPKPKGCI
ncbi:TusE/DsrC/DsvC family sulfur relay protein [Gracilimonas mengyeensis]|uniref:tRNA 2-thiouridine synthesizing protein E n=1 Tax=Gracilimonas mengyeensis TaxID=1302730 RepID=A0A521B6F4_9BACT|nr:TusE/DsrC/DsvC family sulfur relay protein [Gracilimonas mengyeensis]SMO42684.1 tRNA 2-thiouridine synthesizing protein E [Gracilimonas mengyeensis]